MERKTKINAEEGRQDLTVTREFDLPLELLFRAYAEADIVEQWMGTKVLKLENKNMGATSLKHQMSMEMWCFARMVLYMILSRNRKLSAHLKWIMYLLMCSSSSWNLNRLLKIAVNSVCILSIALQRTGRSS